LFYSTYPIGWAEKKILQKRGS